MDKSLKYLIRDLKTILAFMEKLERDAPYQAPEVFAFSTLSVARELKRLSLKITCMVAKR